jgi:hypothetical protein
MTEGRHIVELKGRPATSTAGERRPQSTNAIAFVGEVTVLGERLAHNIRRGL